MKPAMAKIPPDWMLWPETHRVMKALNGKSQSSPNALFVGGCVRNWILEKEVHDIDIACVFEPQRIMAILQEADIKSIPTGLDHGTVTVVTGEKSYEITTLRKDVETDGRRAVVAFTDDWAEDAQRRDFTMNTLLADMRGNIFDPTGQGLSDLQAGRVVFVGDPMQRIAEDVLRILRFFRFHATYGRGEPSEEALSACAAQAEKLTSLSKERVTQEMVKILALADPAPTLELMAAQGVLFVKGADFLRLKTLCRNQNRFALYPDTNLIARIYALPDLREWLILSNRQKTFLKTLGYFNGEKLNDKKYVKTNIYHHNFESVYQVLCSQSPENINDLIAVIKNFEKPVFPLTGDDLIAKGIAPGPGLGRKLKDLEKQWVENDFSFPD